MLRWCDVMAQVKLVSVMSNRIVLNEVILYSARRGNDAMMVCCHGVVHLDARDW